MNPPYPSLEQRVEQLERAVGQLQQAYGMRTAPSLPPLAPPGPWSAPGPPAAYPAYPAAPPVLAAPPRQPFDLARSAEFWLNKLGIGLFLLGIMFFFKYSIDRGWITPALRVLLGGATGAGFLALGLRLRARRILSQALLGGGIAILYISTYAAYQLYGLIGYPAAFGAMLATTLAGFGLAMRENRAALAVIAAGGGLGTPFLLYTGASNVPGLVAYTTLMLAGIGAVYFFKGWRSLIWLAFAGATGIWLAALADIGSGPARFERWALQGGVAASWLLFWSIPIASAVWRRASADAAQADDETIVMSDAGRFGHHAHILSLLSGLWGLWLTTAVWSATLGRDGAGWLALGAAALYGLVALALRRARAGEDFAHSQGFIAAALLAIAIGLLLRDGAMVAALALEAAALHLAARRLDKPLAAARRLDEPLWAAGGHLLAALLGLLFLGRLQPPPWSPLDSVPLLNLAALGDLAAIVLLGGAGWLQRGRGAALAYRLGAYAALLGLIWREWTVANNALVTVGWGLCALALLGLALRRSDERALWAAVATIALVTAKLFLHDLVAVGALWRMLLFLGFGAVFLAASAFFRTAFRPPADQGG
ncbi:MAG TPA: DUF2339 domain-containing protein [Herpetosiphonaceae bacterium]